MAGNNQAPLAVDFSADVTSGAPPLTVTFTDLTTGYPKSWEWDFGDGNVSYAQNPVHIYDTEGTYTVELVVRGLYDDRDTETKTDYITVTAPGTLDYFEKTSGELDFLGVKVCATDTTSQTVWAPGEGDGVGEQEYPGGWVTPGDYTLELNIPRLHELGSHELVGLERPGHAICYKVTSNSVDYTGWIKRDISGDPTAVAPTKAGSSTVSVTLAAGDVLHVSYGHVQPTGTGFDFYNGTDGFTVYCVTNTPVYRAGLWGCEKKTYDTTLWASAAAICQDIADDANTFIGTGSYHQGPTGAMLPDPFPSDFGTITTSSHPLQGLAVGRWCRNRALEKLRDGGGWTGSTAELTRLFEYALNMPQQCYQWGNGAHYYYQHAHGTHWYGEAQMIYMADMIVTAVALGLTPDYEPFHNWLCSYGQRVDMWTGFDGVYANGNNEGAVIDINHVRFNDYSGWVYYVRGVTDIYGFGGMFDCMRPICDWCRELMGMPETPTQPDTYHHTGWNDAQTTPGGTDGGRYGHGWMANGIGPGWAGYIQQECTGCILAFMLGHKQHCQKYRHARRNFYAWDHQADGGYNLHWWWMEHWQTKYIDEPANYSATLNGSDADLAWDAVSGADHYHIYRGASDPDLTPYTEMTLIEGACATNSYTDVGPGSGTWYYAVCAVDSLGNESVRTDIDSVTVP